MFVILGIIAFIVVIMLSVVLHEAGHMVVARMMGLSVPKFFAGFGKTLWSFNHKGTEYGIKAIPLGGFVDVRDMSRKDENEQALLSYVTPWKRIMVFAAGPAVNIVIGVVICFLGLMSVPSFVGTSTVASVNACQSSQVCGADKAGILPGDTLVKIDGTVVDSNGDNIKELLEGKEQAVVTVNREGQLNDLTVPVTDGRIGIVTASQQKYLSPTESLQRTKQLIVLNLKALYHMPEKVPAILKKTIGYNDASTKDTPMSIIGVGKVYSETVSMSAAQLRQESGAEHIPTWQLRMFLLTMYTAMINLGLGLINLIPFLPLDGGRIAIALVDWVRAIFAKVTRRSYMPVSSETTYWMTMATGTLVIGFSVLLITADIVSLIPA